MSDVAKWAILIAVAIAVIAMIVLLPVTGMIDISALTQGLNNIATIMGYYLIQAKGFLNCFVPPGFEWMITASISWTLLSKLLCWVINVSSQAAHYLFK